MFTVRKLVWGLILLGALPAWANDLAVLRNGFSISHQRREQIGSVTRLYLTADSRGYIDVPTADIEHFELDLTPPPPAAETKVEAEIKPDIKTAPVNKGPEHLNLSDLVTNSSNRNQIDPDLINSVIHAESNFNPHAISPKGARGLMQLMPQTASKLGVSNSFDPQANIDGGTRYLRELLELYNFDIIKALAAYNAGPYRVAQYHGVPPYRETRSYVRRIILDFNRKKLAQLNAEKAAKLAASKAASAKGKSQTAPAVPVKQAQAARTTQQLPR